MKLKSKLGVTLVVTGFLLLCLGFSGAWYVLQLQKRNSQILSNKVASIRAAEELELIVREMRHELDRYLLTDNREHLLLAVGQQAESNQWLARASELVESKEEQKLVADIRSGLDDYFIQLHQIADDPTKSISPLGVERLEAETLTAQVLVPAHRFLDLNENELELSSQQNQSMANKLSLVMALLGACGALVGLEAGYGAARGISRSMVQLSVPIRDVAGKLDAVVGPVEISADPSVQDLQVVLETVSARVGHVVDQLHERHNEIIRADQLAAVGKLGAGLAHEIRNPLMCMKTLVQSSRHRGESLNADDLAVLDDEITRVDQLLQSFLDFAKPSQLVLKPFELREIVRGTLELIASRAESRDVKTVCSLPDQPVHVQGDATRLRQVLLNLLLNALDAVDNGGDIFVSLQIDHNDDLTDGHNKGSSGWACLDVADNGCGLPADHARMYDPFFSTKDPGLGLGLSISKRITEDHGGRLTAADRDGGGTVFTLRLPLCSASQTLLP